MTTITPLPRATTKEMERILNGIRSGRMKHDQGEWQCGSFRCFFGWKVFLDMTHPSRITKESCNMSLMTADIIKFFDQQIGTEFRENEIHALEASTVGHYQYVKLVWQLTQQEADIMCHGYATIELLGHMVDMFKQGYRCIEVTTIDNVMFDTYTFREVLIPKMWVNKDSVTLDSMDKGSDYAGKLRNIISVPEKT